MNQFKGSVFVAMVLCGVVFSAEAGFSKNEQNVIDVFKNTTPSVAFIKNATLQWDWFGTNVYEIPQGAGSGFVWDDQGHIVTNFHVIYQASKIEVVLPDQEPYEAKVIGASPDHDLAVLKINAPPGVLKEIPRGSSQDLQVGQTVLAIGNPFGLDHSLSTGVVSALGRSIASISGRKIDDMVQTDAAINPGNSGGPLLNSEGKLIGVSTAIFSPSGAYAGIGFAIPVDTVNRVVPQLIQHGKVKRFGLGISLVPDTTRYQLRLKGALIRDVFRGSGAAHAGLQPTRRGLFGELVIGDLILEVAGKKIEQNEDLLDAFDNRTAGERVEVVYMRNNKVHKVEVELMEL